jgi:hypothetical protein
VERGEPWDALPANQGRVSISERAAKKRLKFRRSATAAKTYFILAPGFWIPTAESFFKMSKNATLTKCYMALATVVPLCGMASIGDFTMTAAKLIVSDYRNRA